LQKIHHQKYKTKRLLRAVTQPCENDVNNFQRFPRNFSESVVRCLTRHFYQKRKLNYNTNNRLRNLQPIFYTPISHDWAVDIILHANCLCSKSRNLWRYFLTAITTKM